MRRFVTVLAVAATLLTGAVTPVVAAPADAGFVTRQGDQLKLDGKRFRFGGTNNYYLMYKSPLMVDDVFADARAAGFTVMRTWGFLDIGRLDGTDSVGTTADGVYFQYWDGTKPAYNDGPDGLQRLDYVLKAARDAGIKLIVPLTNNWRDFGGMDQYVRWRGGQFHDDFYTDATIRGWYQDWISHVLNRTNSLTGIKYRDDPTVMTWELGNEPRCKGSGVYPTSPTCSPAVMTSWVDEISRHIKAEAPRQLVSVGDEGFFCDDRANTDWTTNCGEGVDTIAFTKLPAIDVMSYHLYPNSWGFDADWATDYITRHSREAAAIGKPVMLGEFGWSDKATRNTVYQRWTEAVRTSGGTGWLYWILSGVQDDGTLYPDYDGYTVYCPSPVCTNLSNAAEELSRGQKSRNPVADHDNAVGTAGDTITVRATANDIAYRTKIRGDSIDLDPATAGRQASVTVDGGTFTATAGGAVALAPSDGFTGRAVASYTVRDLAGRTSNAATITVTVNPASTGPLRIASFETDTQGWAQAPWQTTAGTVTRTDEYATDGTFGVRVDAVDGGWFGVHLDTPLDLSGRASFSYDLRTGAETGTNIAIALPNGAANAWCQSGFRWVPQGTTTTADINLLADMSCDPAAFTDVREVWIYINPGTVNLDNVRVE